MNSSHFGSRSDGGQRGNLVAFCVCVGYLQCNASGCFTHSKKLNLMANQTVLGRMTSNFSQFKIPRSKFSGISGGPTQLLGPWTRYFRGWLCSPGSGRALGGRGGAGATSPQRCLECAMWHYSNNLKSMEPQLLPLPQQQWWQPGPRADVPFAPFASAGLGTSV